MSRSVGFDGKVCLSRCADYIINGLKRGSERETSRHQPPVCATPSPPFSSSFQLSFFESRKVELSYMFVLHHIAVKLIQHLFVSIRTTNIYCYYSILLPEYDFKVFKNILPHLCHNCSCRISNMIQLTNKNM